MKLKDLYLAAKEINLIDEEVEEVLRMYELPPEIFNRGVCGLCIVRNTTACPFPKSGLCDPICLSFVKIEK